MTNSTNPFGNLFDDDDDDNDSRPDDLDQLIDANALNQLSALVDRRIHTVLDALIEHHLNKLLQTDRYRSLTQALPTATAPDPYRLCVMAEGTPQAVQDFLHRLHTAQIVEMNDWSRSLPGRTRDQVLRVYTRHYPWLAM